MVKKIVPVVVLLLALAGGYKFVLAKPAKAEEKPKVRVEGTVYMLQKEFLVNLADGRFAKMQIGLILAHDDTSTAPAGGHEAASPPEGYGPMTQEGIVRSLITGELTDHPADELTNEKKREEL